MISLGSLDSLVVRTANSNASENSHCKTLAKTVVVIIRITPWNGTVVRVEEYSYTVG